ncbi:telomere-associated protein RIF1-like [Crotalus tigris]|uniref:telomere-associated protein RIF1-like n=1 Tax=Crotalus tigris TaxID=88082 RepID=UPI00192F1B2B|nr:telomere-associated protein RIF1-like [Crotalus tigris]
MGPCDGTSLRALLETLEDPAASLGALTDALLTLTNRLTENEEDEDEGRELAIEIENCFPQLYKIFMTYIPSENAELSSAALQALGYCVFNPKISSLLCEIEIHELLSTLNNVALNSGDKHTRTRALWVISKQSFPPDTVAKLVPSIIAMLETVLEGDLHSMVVEYEALNVIIRLIEQAPSDMEQQAVKWAKIIIPLVVHSAHKVQLRAASALEMGLPLLQQHQEVITVTEQIMTTKVIPELQKLFFSKHETYILKLWPLFIKLLGKTLHHSGSFINSLLHLEELGFRSGSPVVKKIAFIAWKSLIDNFALNPDILCSAKRLRLLMQPLSSIHVRTETLAVTKLEVWWYLLIRLGSQLPVHFEQVGVPLIQNTLCLDASQLQGNSSRFISNQSLAIPGCSQKSGVFPFGNVASPRMTQNASIGGAVVIPSIQILGIEMLLHFFKGQEILTFAEENNIVLSLEPLQYPVITSLSFFCKHASVFINAAQDGFIAVGQEISDCMLTAIWKELVGFVKAAIESGNKRERSNSEVLTMLLQTLKNIIMSKQLPVLNSLSLLEVAIKELPPKVLGSPAYLIADMDLLNGTPALFLLQLLFFEDLLEYGVQSQRFFLNYESLVECALSGPTSPLSFTESVLTIMSQSAMYLENKNYLWRMWSIIVNPLIEWIKQTNDVNQGDALEHNFNAIYSALLLPVNCIFSSEFPQSTAKILLRSWSELYKAFARCALLVPTAEDNVCCDDLCAKIISGLDDEAHLNQSMLDALSCITAVMVECINFAPYDKKYQPANRSPQTPMDWAKKKKDPLGKLSSLIKLLIILTNSLQRLASEQSGFEELAPVGFEIVGVLQNIIGHISLPSVIRAVFGFIAKPLAALYEKITSANPSRMSYGLDSKCEKLLADSLTCVQSNYTGSFNSELLEELCPLLTIMFLNKNKQISSHAAQFWNATFGKAVTLTYPEELKSVLYKAKQKFILLLPVFESCEIMEGSSTAYSDYTENSQWDANISGMTVNPNGKRDSFLSQINEPEKENINVHIAPKKIKLEFSGSKSKPKNIPLEEENTMDFVFIPLEAKERVLTEHQKEVLRTKRDDIPVMYNNLDTSQDAVLFSQDIQNQEDSLEKPIVVDTKEEHEEKEDKLTAQKKQARSHQLFIPHAVTGHYKSNVSQDNSTSTVTKQANTLKKEKLDQKNEELDVGIPLQSPTSDSILNENPPNGSSNSSTSSDIISATPQVAVNRRQAFVTLEKFDDFDNGPFGPSVFNNISITLTSPFIQKESTVLSDVSPKGKPDLENKSGLKLRARKTVSGTKRSRSEILNALEMCVKAKRSKEENTTEPELESINTIEIKKPSLGQNKTSEDKSSEQMQSGQEEKIQICDTHCEEKHELSVDRQAVEYLLDNQAQVPGVRVADGTIMKSKPLQDMIQKESAGPNLEHRENISPEIDVHEEAVSEVNQSLNISLNQKTLRRSLRRKAETDGAVDTQDKKDNQQKEKQKDDEKTLPKKMAQNEKAEKLEKASDAPVSVEKQKDNEKILPRKMAQNRETPGQKEKAKTLEKASDASGSVGVNSATGNIDARENSQEELHTSLGKSERSPASDFEESGQDAPVEKLKLCPRYHTRRAASQGLLTNLEKCESDSSETREEGAKRKWFGKLRKYDSSGNQVKEEPESQEFCSQAAVEIQTQSVGKQKIPPGRETEMPSMSTNAKEIGTKEEKGTLPLSPCVDLKENAGASHPRASSDTGRRKPANRRESTSEPILENRQEPSTLDTRSVVPNNPSGVSEGDASATAVSAFTSPKTFLDISECQHKRSKRARKSRSCECCDEKLSPQVEKPKKASTPEPKLKEPRKVLSKVTMALTLIPNAEEIPLAERLSAEPCATSTPLPFVEDGADVKEASTVAESVSGRPRDNAPNAELEKLARVQSECDQPIAEIIHLPSSETISESSSVDSHSEELSAQDHSSEPGSVDSYSEDVSAQDRSSEPGSVDSYSEELNAQDQSSEPGSVDSFPEELNAQDQSPEPGSVDSHSEDLSAQDRSSEPGSVDSYSEDLSAQDRSSEPGSVDSHSEAISPQNQALEPVSMDFHLEDVNAQDQGLEPDVEGDVIMESNNDQNGQLESKTDIEFKIIQIVGTQPRERAAQNTVGETRVTSAIEVAELQENETNEEEGAEDNAAYAPSELPTLVLDSPPKLKEIDILSLAKVSGSPGTQTRFLWSPTASPSTSILKRVIKTEHDSSPPPNKNRRVSFANPIYKEELADDIDRRSPVLRIHPYNNDSQSLRNVKSSPSHQAKLITTPTKGSLSPGTRSHKYKSSKKCLMTEMVTEPTTAPKESVYPALVGCKASVDILLPQITPNSWTRGLGHLIRAKNIRTVGDLSSLTRAQIKTLPIRSPRVLNVRKVLKGYHDQQVKARGMEQMDETLISANENAVMADGCETEVSSTEESTTVDIWTLINLLLDQTSPERLLHYSGNEVIEMQQKISSISDCMINSVKSRYELL